MYNNLTKHKINQKSINSSLGHIIYIAHIKKEIPSSLM